MSQSSPEKDIANHGTPTAGGRAVRPHRSVRMLLVRVGLFACVAELLAFVVMLPVRFPSLVNTYAAITPEHRWVLERATDGKLIASTFNYRLGLSEGFRVSTFNPGSSINFSLQPSLVPGRPISMGDTIGSIYSSEVAERLIALNGQLAAARNLLAVNASGQKSAVVNEAQQRLQFARRRRDEYQRTLERTQRLFDQKLIPEGEYDRVKSEANALEDEITLAAANLETAQTGAKPEQINLVNANISALESEIDAVKRRAATFIVTAPIAGTVTPSFSPDTLLTISGPEYLALIPIRRTDYRRVASTPGARFTLGGLSLPVRGRIVAFDRDLHVMSGHEVVIATAQLEGTSPDLMSGMLLPCRIQCAPVTVGGLGRQVLASLRASRALFGGL